MKPARNWFQAILNGEQTGEFAFRFEYRKENMQHQTQYLLKLAVYKQGRQ
jgi:hypothetical protein